MDVRAAEGEQGAAQWAVRRRWPVAGGFALVPVVLTAAASAVAQVAHAGESATALTLAGGAAVSALAGVIVMRTSPPSLREYGFRRPRAVSAVWWLAPLPITVVIALLSQGVHVSGQALAAYAVLTPVVAVNEEVWFRGIVLAVLRSGGVRVAVVGSSVLFAVLHLANLAGGEDPAAAVLQLVFAALFGFVAALLVVHTGSLWPAIAWHAAWDFVNYLGGNGSSAAALAGIAIACAVMGAYAIALASPVLRAQAAQAPRSDSPPVA